MDKNNEITIQQRSQRNQTNNFMNAGMLRKK